MFSEVFIEKVREANDIVDIISEYVSLEKKGKDYFGLCPFHREKTASFSVVPSKQIYYCFGCNKGGNVIHFIKEIERLSFTEAVEYLAERAGIKIEETRSKKDMQFENLKKEVYEINKLAARYYFDLLHSPKGVIAQQYLVKRKITVKTATSFGLGYSPDAWNDLYNYLKPKGFSEECLEKCGLFNKNKNGEYIDRFRNRLMYPIFNVSGSVVGFGGRRLNDNDAKGINQAKYINSTETPVYIKGRNLYGLNFVKTNSTDTLIIVEGYMDVIAMHQAGFKNSVASLGTALTEGQARLLKKYATEIIICYDADTAGQAATIRGLDILKKVGCNVRVMKILGGKDPDEFIKANGTSAFKQLIDDAVSLVDYKVDYLSQSCNMSTIDGKTKFANELSALLAGLENRVERELYIEKFAGQYNIGIESLKELVSTKVEGNTSNVLSRSVSSVVSNYRGTSENKLIDKCVYDERMLLVFLCLAPSSFDLLSQTEMNPDSFRMDNDKILAAKIYDIIYAEDDINESRLLDFVDANDVNFFAQLINKDCKCEQPDLALKEKIADVRRDRIEIEIASLKSELSAIESLPANAENNSRRSELVEQLSAMILKKNAINN